MPDDARLGRAIRDALKKNVRGKSGKVYADLGGKVLGASEYEAELEKDDDFAERQIVARIKSEPQDPTPSSISVREQHILAADAAKFILAAKDKTPEAFVRFLARRPKLAQAYPLEALQRVVETLEIEQKLSVRAPSPEEHKALADAADR